MRKILHTDINLLTDREWGLIELAAAAAADKAASKVYAESVGGFMDHYRTVEKLLYNYKRLEALVKREHEYLSIEPPGKSKSVVVCMPSGGTYRVEEDVAGAIARERLLSYEKTAANFRDVEKVIKLFRERKEFVVIAMYYLQEDPEGNELAPDEAYTWEDIAYELCERGILRDVKTARRWRTNLINDIAVCMFGKAAAMTVSSYRSKIS